MFLTYIVLAVALSLSGIAAFYSIAGLTAIFAAATVPIAVMGTILEIAKLAITVWLHEYWHRVRWTMKAYLVPAVILLMIITSMGIFGFLSKAHLDQAVPTGDVAAQVDLIDEKIRTQQDNIAAAKTSVQQMDSQVNERLSRSNDDRGAERAVQIRRQQQAERVRLQREIAQAQSIIADLNEQRAPIASELRKVEAEVGPIKYIAALVYGDNPEVNVLEKAVRWVIIVLVMVFDPLAIMMLLAFTESHGWERERQLTQSQSLDAAVSDLAESADPSPQETAQDSSIEQTVTHDYLQKEWKHHVPGVDPVGPIVYVPETTADTENQTQETLVIVEHEHPMDRLLDDAESADDEFGHHDNKVKEAMRLWKQANPGRTLKDQRHRYEQGLIDQLPWMSLVTDDLPEPTLGTGFGNRFPEHAVKGDLWIRTDRIPHVLYRYNENDWIEISKQIADSYTYNDAYIDHLIQQLEQGQYDPDFLTAAETEQISNRLGKHNQ